MGTKLVSFQMIDPPPTRLYCPFTGSLVISADDPLQVESRLEGLSPHLRFVLFYERTSYPAFWAANPDMLSEEQRKIQEAVIRLWTTAAGADQATVTMDGDWYIDYLNKLEEVLPSSSFLLEINSFYQSNIPESALKDPNLHVSWDFSAAYTIAALFIAERPPKKLAFRRVKTMWDDFIPNFTPKNPNAGTTSAPTFAEPRDQPAATPVSPTFANSEGEQTRTVNVVQSALALPLAILTWVIVYTIAYVALRLLDRFRGIENDLLQSIFRELITPGIGGYTALYVVHSWLTHANLKFVVWGFCAPVFLFMIGLPVFFVFFLPDGWTFSWGEQIIRWLGGAATICGAWIAYKQLVDRS